jgi:phosphoribosylformylglycinamidine synthase
MLWHIRITPAAGQRDLEARRVVFEADELHLPGPWTVFASRGFLVEGRLSEAQAREIAARVFVDAVVETAAVEPCGLATPAASNQAEGFKEIHVLRRPGVTDPEGESAIALLRDLGYPVEHCRTIRSYRVAGPPEALDRLIGRVLANDSVETTVRGPIRFDRLGFGKPYRFELVMVRLRDQSDEALVALSRAGQLSLSLAEMQAIQAHFRALGRDPTDCELETLAQTWSEHCSHKTLRGVIDFEGEIIENLLKTTIFHVTKSLDLDWMVSVFEDNAGVVRFDKDYDVCFKVETHNHPSAIDPYGGANTGIGGVIRDPLGTGLGAKPICNTDVFCVAPPDTPPEEVPAGVIHPRRVLRGVVAGVRDYGNRMGIPTVNGALAVDPGYLANPLVFCGTLGVLPRGMAHKKVEPGDLIVAIGGRTGRDGIHGATFSSLELSSESESVSSGAVQIGNAITEKMVLDVVLQARDRGLFRSITDCGAGGFSSAIGEMGAMLGAEVDLERAPLKYEGLSYTEIWISEAQERMVLAVPPENWDAFRALCALEHVEATVLGRFIATGRLTLRYEGTIVGDLAMEFLHEGRPRVVRKAHFNPPAEVAARVPQRDNYNEDLLRALSHWDVASKEWIVRQYDHEVQGRTIIKPLVGPHSDGPGDAAVMLPVRGSSLGLAVACGLNPRFGVLDPYAMAGCCIDEAIRNCICVGANPERIALLDNFCWGSPERPEELGSLVRAAQGCRDIALAFRAPFISGKDSLYNEYTHEGRRLAIPPTLLISAIGVVDDVRACVTMDAKEAGNQILLVGETREELGGSIWLSQHGIPGGRVPRVDTSTAPSVFRALHSAISAGLIRACHDLSEGGLAAGLAEMALAGRLGIEAALPDVPRVRGVDDVGALLFSESPSRFLIEVRPQDLDRVARLLESFAIESHARIGHVLPGSNRRLIIRSASGRAVVDLEVSALEAAWKQARDLAGTPPAETSHIN